jgi:hypothetical protein
MINQSITPEEWNSSSSSWNSGDPWDQVTVINYKRESNSTLYTSGEYVVLGNTQPYLDVLKATGVHELFDDMGVGTILKKEFRYSVDSLTFSEFQETTPQNLEALGSFRYVWFQFRYILLSGGPIKINKASLIYTTIPQDPYAGYIAPAIQDESRVYAFPVTYKSNFLWEPYKMNRAVRLYKDLNLMVNNLFGHETTYYRALPQGRSKDVFLMEYSLYNHDDGRCVKLVVPDNQFPDNKLNMGPFGVDFEIPFEVQVDKDYFQKIFGDGSGPQKRDVLYFPRTGRIYEVSSSYLFRDFMNEPLYFKVTLIKWLPKSNAENSETLTNLEEYTVSAGSLFGELIQEDEVKTTNPQQFTVATTTDDPVRLYINPEQQINQYNLFNYYTLVSEYNYSLDNLATLPKITVSIDTQFLEKDKKYYARFDPGSTQSDIQWYYSMKKLVYEGLDEDGKATFMYEKGGSQVESLYPASEIFYEGSLFYLYENEYVGATGSTEYVASCDTTPAEFFSPRVVKYNAVNTFTTDENRAYSAWFKIKESTYSKNVVDTFVYDQYTLEIDITLVKKTLYFVGDMLVLKRSTSSDFYIFGRITQIISDTQYKISVDQEIVNYVQQAFPAWKSYIDLTCQKTFPHTFINSMNAGKGWKIELFENRHFKITAGDKYYYFSVPASSLPYQIDKWYALFFNWSNLFKQLTLNVWEIQWDPVTNLPATTDMKLTYNRTLSIVPVDLTSGVNYFITPSFTELTNIRIFKRTAETDKQVFILNQNIVKDAQNAIVIDNALKQSRLPYIGYTR